VEGRFNVQDFKFVLKGEVAHMSAFNERRQIKMQILSKDALFLK
jgi:hypothetical protein